MGKLNQSQRAVVGSYTRAAIVKPSAKRQVSVSCISKEAGEEVAGAIQAAYPKYKLYKTQNMFGSAIGYIATGILGPIGTAGQLATDNWKAFTVRCTTQKDAQKLAQEIESCIEEYGGGGNVDIGDDGDEDIGPGIEKSTIIVIAVAVVAIVAVIIFTRKKKR